MWGALQIETSLGDLALPKYLCTAYNWRVERHHYWFSFVTYIPPSQFKRKKKIFVVKALTRSLRTVV